MRRDAFAARSGVLECCWDEGNSRGGERCDSILALGNIHSGLYDDLVNVSIVKLDNWKPYKLLITFRRGSHGHGYLEMSENFMEK